MPKGPLHQKLIACTYMCTFGNPICRSWRAVRQSVAVQPNRDVGVCIQGGGKSSRKSCSSSPLLTILMEYSMDPCSCNQLDPSPIVWQIRKIGRTKLMLSLPFKGKLPSICAFTRNSYKTLWLEYAYWENAVDLHCLAAINVENFTQSTSSTAAACQTLMPTTSAL